MRGRRVLEGSEGGKIPEETLVLKDSQVSLLALSFQLFQNILPLFRFVQISYYGNNKKLSDHFTNWAMKTLVNIALFLGNVNLKNFLNFWHYMLFVCKIVESSIAYCIDCFWEVSKVKYIFLGWWLDGWPIWVRIPRKIS